MYNLKKMCYHEFLRRSTVKRILATCAILLLLAGCTERTQFGECKGIGEDQNPKLSYKVNAWNLIMGLFFVELIVPPVIVATDEFYCPVGPKEAQ
jgi:hypothetical protein